MTFKPNDKVVCTNAIDQNILTEKQTYTVEAVEPIWLKLKDHEHWWLSSRFKKLKEKSKCP